MLIIRCNGCDKDITDKQDHGLTGERADGMDKNPDGTDVEILSVEARAVRIPCGRIDLCVSCATLAFSVLPKFRPKTERERLEQAFVPFGEFTQKVGKAAEAFGALATQSRKADEAKQS